MGKRPEHETTYDQHSDQDKKRARAISSPTSLRFRNHRPTSCTINCG